MGRDVDVTAADELTDGAALQVEVDGEPIGLYNVGGAIYAMDDLCTHDHAFLSEGDLNAAARTVRCPRHSSHFDLTSGCPTSLPAIRPVRTYAAKIQDARVVITVDN